MYDESHYRDEHVVPRGATQASLPYSGAPESEQFFSLREALRTVEKRLWAIALVTLLCVGASVGFSLLQTPVYVASTKILVGQDTGGDQQANLAGSVEGLQQLTQTMVEAINSRPVADAVIRRLEVQTTPRTLLDNLTIEQIGETQFIQLSYEDTDPERASSVVNAVADVASERISQASTGASNLTATVWERATVPSAPVRPEPVRNGLLALGLGLMLGMGMVFLLEYLDDSWRSPEEVERVSGMPMFGVIPNFEEAKSRQERY